MNTQMNSGVHATATKAGHSSDRRSGTAVPSFAHWAFLTGCLIAIPAFYIELLAPSQSTLLVARSLYAVMASACTAALVKSARGGLTHERLRGRYGFDLAIACGAFLSLIGGATPWSSFEWIFRLAFMAMIALRIVIALRIYVEPTRLAWLPVAGTMVLLLGGAGFYALEPHVHSYAEGLWLAFESSATVGYGDIAPTTPASRIFAVFVVLLGYGMFSLVFAGLAAWLIGKEERLLRHEMHRDIKTLHEDIQALRREFKSVRAAVTSKSARAMSRDGAEVVPDACARRKGIERAD
ncbi:potassium channel family protein [Paraburkholderia bannensis]|uniref:potassium channel family protein n=1 Tax=Paraburkholderia bannensis TaxID=765414 RepID=UPI002ABDD7A4|nr:potassium channel family protein [Paraburkholderia bannensis]